MLRYNRFNLNELPVGTHIMLDPKDVPSFVNTQYGSSGTSRSTIALEPDIRHTGYVVRQNAKSTVIVIEVYGDGEYYYDGDTHKFVSTGCKFDSYTIHHKDTIVVKVSTYDRKRLLPVDPKCWWGRQARSTWETMNPTCVGWVD